jgi:cyclopropane fatty-acyl-phospholipid synthase-like methyltransferase
MAAGDERDNMAVFSERYGIAIIDATREMELAVIGGDWGSNGYTTMAQADTLAGVLALGPGSRLLDVGAGRGWPGLYLAARTGCRVVLADLPLGGLALARQRADAEGLRDRSSAVVASGRRLPLRAGSFDAVVNTDVLC